MIADGSVSGAKLKAVGMRWPTVACGCARLIQREMPFAEWERIEVNEVERRLLAIHDESVARPPMRLVEETWLVLVTGVYYQGIGTVMWECSLDFIQEYFREAAPVDPRIQVQYLDGRDLWAARRSMDPWDVVFREPNRDAGWAVWLP